ncbi:MAG: hypothetical protein JXA98_08350 [Methanosarcinaceae archaeon]|nr:hypothetical protein [Methanosarcinaceae archaeon]
MERVEKYLQRLEKGKVSSDEIYPPKDRFKNLKEPIAKSPLAGFSVWSMAPFYGSTLVPLIPRGDTEKFDDFYTTGKFGFSSKDIDKMIDLVKETGRIQFIINFPPTYYENLDFLEPLFRELEPPAVIEPLDALIAERKREEYAIEFDKLTSFGFEDFVKGTYGYAGIGRAYLKQKMGSYLRSYAGLKFLGYDDLVYEIEELMITNQPEALRRLIIFGNMLVRPSLSPLKEINNFNVEQFTELEELGGNYGFTPQTTIPNEIGRFILEKLVRYPENLNAFWDITQYYDDEELYKVLGALNDGVKKQNIDLIKDNQNDLSIIMENVWAETGKIKRNTKIARWSIGLGGGLSANLLGMGELGILAGLGISAADEIIGLNSDSVSEKIAKFISPNYLVALYDFKKKHENKMYKSE